MDKRLEDNDAEMQTVVERFISERLMIAQMGDGNQYKANPKGQNPVCKPKLRTSICERCGTDVKTYRGPCLAVPENERWGEDWLDKQ